MWVKQCHKPPMTGGWFMTLLDPHVMHSWTGMQNLLQISWEVLSGKLTVRPCQPSGLEDEFPFKVSHFQGSNCEFTVWINERSSPFIPWLPEIKFVPDDLVRMDKTHRMPVKKKSAFSIRGYLGSSWRYRCWWKEWYQDRRSDVWKWMCSAMCFFLMFYGIKKGHLISLGYFFMGHWSHLIWFWGYFSVCLKIAVLHSMKQRWNGAAHSQTNQCSIKSLSGKLTFETPGSARNRSMNSQWFLGC